MASGSIVSPSVEISHNFNFSEGRKLQPRGLFQNVDREDAEISRDKGTKFLRKLCLIFCFTVPILLSMGSDGVRPGCNPGR